MHLGPWRLRAARGSRRELPPAHSTPPTSLLTPFFFLPPLQMLQPQFKSHNTNEVLEKLFQIVPGENPYRFRDPRQCRRCAVVGNSGNLRGSGYGPDVDGHNFIMR